MSEYRRKLSDAWLCIGLAWVIAFFSSGVMGQGWMFILVGSATLVLLVAEWRVGRL